MFSKLAFKNVGRSMKDYGVWFLTIAFGVCLFYVFNSLETQAVFQYLGSGPQAPTAQAIRELIGMLSVFVWVVLAFLILYASGFLIRRRKGELGTYLLLGMERGQVARLLLLETLCMGVLALLAGKLGYDPDVRCTHHDEAHGEGSHTCGSHGCGNHSCH